MNLTTFSILRCTSPGQAASFCLILLFLLTFAAIICQNDEFSLSLCWLYCLRTDSEVFISFFFAEIKQILQKIILFPFWIYVPFNVSSRLFQVNSNSNLSLWQTNNCSNRFSFNFRRIFLCTYTYIFISKFWEAFPLSIAVFIDCLENLKSNQIILSMLP